MRSATAPLPFRPAAACCGGAAARGRRGASGSGRPAPAARGCRRNAMPSGSAWAARPGGGRGRRRSSPARRRLAPVAPSRGCLAIRGSAASGRPALPRRDRRPASVAAHCRRDTEGRAMPRRCERRGADRPCRRRLLPRSRPARVPAVIGRQGRDAAIGPWGGGSGGAGSRHGPGAGARRLVPGGIGASRSDALRGTVASLDCFVAGVAAASGRRPRLSAAFAPDGARRSRRDVGKGATRFSGACGGCVRPSDGRTR